MKVKFLKLHPDAEVPTKAYADDYCYDLKAISEEEIHPGVWKYGFGLAFQIDKGHVFNPNLNYSIKIKPRSSIFKTGMELSNSVGVVDFGYRNEVSAIFYHLKPELPRYRKGDYVAQMCIEVTTNIDFEEVEQLDPSERGLKGYGSSDNKRKPRT